MRTAGMLVVAVLVLAGQCRPLPGASGPKCSAVTFTVRLDAGKSFARKVGDLQFNLSAMHDKGMCGGWAFSLDDARGNDFLYPVNMPLRFNPAQLLGCSYGLTARQGLEVKRDLRFILTEHDYRRLDPLLDAALWPADSPDPKKARENYLQAVSSIRTGLLRLRTLHFELAPDGLIRSAVFRVELIASNGFNFGTSQNPLPAPCPAEPAP